MVPKPTAQHTVFRSDPDPDPNHRPGTASNETKRHGAQRGPLGRVSPGLVPGGKCLSWTCARWKMSQLDLCQVENVSVGYVPGGKRPSLVPGGKRPSLVPGGKRPGLVPGGKRPSLVPGGRCLNWTCARWKMCLVPGGKRPGLVPGGKRPGLVPGGKRPGLVPGGKQSHCK